MEVYMGNQKQINTYIRFSGYLCFIQFALIILSMISMAVWGMKPTNASEAYEMMANNPIIGLLRDEILILMMMSLYLFTFPAMFLILAKVDFTKAFIATIMTLVAVTISIAVHSGFSLLHLSALYSSATTDIGRNQILGAGEAILARNMWHTTAGFFGGIFLQGGAVLMSLAMLKTKSFSNITIFTGIIANGLDLIQHFLHYSFPDIAGTIIMVAGLFYFIWYITLGRDLIKISKEPLR